MARLYALDTNLYVRAFRDARELAALKRFLLRVGARVVLPAVVAVELRAGARAAAHEAAVDGLVAPYAERRRVLVPSFGAFLQAGRVLADLVRHERLVLADAPRSLTGDALLAAACREAGVVLVTDNHADFARIKRHLRGFRFEQPWPTV